MMTTGVLVALAAAALGIAVFLLAAKICAGTRLDARHVGSFGLAAVLCAFFYLFCVLSPQAQGTPWLGVAIIAATTGVIRLMTRFESPR